jgi:hypothetical protein
MTEVQLRILVVMARELLKAVDPDHLYVSGIHVASCHGCKQKHDILKWIDAAKEI